MLSLKSLEFTPLIVMPLIASGVLPRLVRVTLFTVLVCPTAQEPKFTLLVNFTQVGFNK